MRGQKPRSRAFQTPQILVTHRRAFDQVEEVADGEGMAVVQATADNVAVLEGHRAVMAVDAVV